MKILCTILSSMVRVSVSRSKALIVAASLMSLPITAAAEEWCSVTNFGVTENSGSVTLVGALSGPSGSSWTDWLVLDQTNNPDTAKKRLSLVLFAAATGRQLSIYVPGSYTCANVPHWQNDVVLHVRVR